ncbi:hypothetical protein PWT90_08714 [Aphanocladium album]|nr:hypothetical protein PWT90_08714 [Aphanocladium album]
MDQAGKEPTNNEFLQPGRLPGDNIRGALTDAAAEAPANCQEQVKLDEIAGLGNGDAALDPLEPYIRPYSAFALWQKRLVVSLGAAAGWFSTSSSFIFFPAIPFLARDLGASTERINLTVTSYLIASGVFPSLIAGLSDVYGRRPIFVITLGSYVAVNIGLALQRSFGVLLGLRMLQSAAISGTFAFSYGILGDVTTPADRGGFIGLMSIFLNTPPSVAPLISGLLLIRWGWQAIFWFLVIASGTVFLCVLFFLPETCRNIVGDGSLSTQWQNKVIFPCLKPPKQEKSPDDPDIDQPRPKKMITPMEILMIFKNPGTSISIICYGIFYTMYSCLQASLSTIFVEQYGVSGLTAGLSYLPFGIATVIASTFGGMLLDREYKKVAASMGITLVKGRLDDMADFPIERARLNLAKWAVVFCVPLIVGYGWALQYHTVPHGGAAGAAVFHRLYESDKLYVPQRAAGRLPHGPAVDDPGGQQSVSVRAGGRGAGAAGRDAPAAGARLVLYGDCGDAGRGLSVAVGGGAQYHLIQLFRNASSTVPATPTSSAPTVQRSPPPLDAGFAHAATFTCSIMEDQSSHSRHLGRSVSQPEARPSPSVHHSRRFDGRHIPLAFIQTSPLILSESWVELSSQPSSSSLSSVDNEIVTTGLQVGNSPFQRRRRLHPSSRTLPPQHQQTALHMAGASSQDEEEESDSEDDRLMTSSAENIHSSEKEPSDDSDNESDDADNATTLGRRTSDAPVFRPHPNAFTHPPAGLGQRSYSTSSADQPHPHSSFRRSSYPHRSQARGHRGGAPNFMSPSVREDNDAALRASLTTLLSCAAAARGLPKKEETDAQRATRTGVAPSDQPMELRFMPESELASDEKQTEAAGPAAATRRRRASPSRSGAVSPKSKRSESAGRGPRAAKKKRTAVVSTEEALISPTLLSWVVSAGVVVLVSVVGFGAGYVIGREVGREEAREALAASISSGANDTTSAGGDVIRSSVGLRKLRWSAVGRSIVAQA